METSVTFPGLPAIVPSARRFVRGILAGSPRADDMELIAAELASNAIRHTPSGQDGGEFTLMVRTEPGWARIEVSDAGTGEWSGPRDASDDDEYGRGLAIVAALADKFGHDVRASGQTVWAEGRVVERRSAATGNRGRHVASIFAVMRASFGQFPYDASINASIGSGRSHDGRRRARRADPA